MARKFSFPAIESLVVGKSCDVSAPFSEVKRKTALFAKRNGKRFEVTRSPDARPNSPLAVVTRLPDPVSDSELPSAA